MNSTNGISRTQSSLEHYGTKGHSGRYPLGSGERPYQGYGGLSKRKAKKAGKSYEKEKKKLEKIVAKETEKQQKEAEEAKKREEKAAREREKTLRDPASLKKHQYEYSEKEINDALQRFRWEEDLHQQARKKLERGANILDSMYKYMSVGLKYYNFAAGTHNAFKPDDKPWTKINIGAGDTSSNKKKPSSK